MVYRYVDGGSYVGGFESRPYLRLQNVISGIGTTLRCWAGQALWSHAARSIQSSWPVSASVSSTPEMRAEKASFLTLEGTRITPVCE
jgi:hypothetical protein